ncbi:MAG: hypothetical protein AB8I08_04840 [Sandaracinaceae bacterium]
MGNPTSPAPLTENELDARHQTKSRLKSGGDYGCLCAYFEEAMEVDAGWLADWPHVCALFDADTRAQLTQDHGHADIGTVCIAGDVTVRGEFAIPGQLMCLIVLGDLRADTIHINETEVFVAGTITGEVNDVNGYLTVAGAS